MMRQPEIDLRCDDCREVLKTLADNSIDAVVTDPPYELGFMGKDWDGRGIAFDPALWGEVLRVLKPGGHLAAFSASRTYHRMACAIEDAGFEIRDSLMWLYGTGFPKNHRINQSPMFCQCGETGHNGDNRVDVQSQDVRNDRQAVSVDGDLQLLGARYSSNKVQGLMVDYQLDRGCNDARLRPAAVGDLTSFPSPQYAQEHNRSFEHGNGQAFGSSHIPCPAQYNDLPSNPDSLGRVNSQSDESVRISASKSRADISGLESRKQDTCLDFSSRKYASGFPRCQVCEKPNTDGFGSALKPAHEPIVLARKPLSEKTVAANVLKWGCSALNIDSCRISASDVIVQRPWANDQNLCASCAELAASKTKRSTRVTKASTATKPVKPTLSAKDAANRADTNRPDIGCSDGTKQADIFTSLSTAKSGNALSGQSLTDGKSITSTGANQITASRTCSCCAQANTADTINENISAERKTWQQDVNKPRHQGSGDGLAQNGLKRSALEDEKNIIGSIAKGRWPANLVHDGSDEVMGMFPQTSSGNGAVRNNRASIGYSGSDVQFETTGYQDKGSAARFFYSAKASKADRAGSKHPTVKPIALMQWLARLITPPGGTILDPFAGTGTLGEAALREGFNAILIEREASYQDDIRIRRDAERQLCFIFQSSLGFQPSNP